MKLGEVEVGQDYAVWLDHRLRYQDADLEDSLVPVELVGEDEARERGWLFLAGARHVGSMSPRNLAKVRVTAIGVPYGKGLQGVRIEYAYQVHRPHRCVCGNEHLEQAGPVDYDDEDQRVEFVTDERTNQATIHVSALLAHWDEWPMHVAIEQHEREQQADDWMAANEERLAALEREWEEERDA